MSTKKGVCQLIQLPKISDHRGNLTFIENLNHIPFEIKRVFYLYDIPGGETRAGHALKSCEEFLVAVSGSFEVIVDDGRTRKNFLLNRTYLGLYVPSFTWRELLNFTTGSVCLSLTSELFSEDDYIRDHSEFLVELQNRNQ